MTGLVASRVGGGLAGGLMVAVLAVIVLPPSVTVPLLFEIAPPEVAVFPEIVEVVTVSVPLLWLTRAPP